MFFWHSLITKYENTNFIAKCNNKLLLQSASGIAMCDSYYKVRRILNKNRYLQVTVYNIAA